MRIGGVDERADLVGGRGSRRAAFETAVVSLTDGQHRLAELQQEVEIARAVSTKSRLLILDEATSSLSEAAAARLLEIVEDQRSQAGRLLDLLMDGLRARQAT